jgi:hypothetical protein
MGEPREDASQLPAPIFLIPQFVPDATVARGEAVTPISSVIQGKHVLESRPRLAGATFPEDAQHRRVQRRSRQIRYLFKVQRAHVDEAGLKIRMIIIHTPLTVHLRNLATDIARLSRPERFG